MTNFTWTDEDGDKGQLAEASGDEAPEGGYGEKTATLATADEDGETAVFIVKKDAEGIVTWLTEFFGL